MNNNQAGVMVALVVGDKVFSAKGLKPLATFIKGKLGVSFNVFIIADNFVNYHNQD